MTVVAVLVGSTLSVLLHQARRPSFGTFGTRSALSQTGQDSILKAASQNIHSYRLAVR